MNHLINATNRIVQVMCDWMITIFLEYSEMTCLYDDSGLSTTISYSYPNINDRLTSLLKFNPWSAHKPLHQHAILHLSLQFAKIYTSILIQLCYMWLLYMSKKNICEGFCWNPSLIARAVLTYTWTHIQCIKLQNGPMANPCRSYMPTIR